jgi:hypothetical protein
MSNTTNISSIFRPSDNSAHNLISFVQTQKNSVFPFLFQEKINWEEYNWNIKGFESTTRIGTVNQSKTILFTQFNGIQGTKIKTSRHDEKPFDEPFLSFVKAHITFRHHAKRKTKDNHMVTIRAYRYLYALLPDEQKEIDLLTSRNFDQAAGNAIARESGSSAYRAGVALAEIATFLRANRLTPMAIRWKNPISRHSGNSGIEEKNTKEAAVRRAQKLPKTDVLIYLSALYHNWENLAEKDKPLLCITIILLFLGFRIDESLSLDIDCLSTDIVFNPDIGVDQIVMKLRVLAKKSGEWESKPVPFSVQDIVVEALERLKHLSQKHRHAAKLLLQEKKYHKLEHLDDDELLGTRDLMDLMGLSSNSNAGAVMKNRNIPFTLIKSKRTGKLVRAYKVGDIHVSLYNEFVEKHPDIVNGFGNDDLRINLWELLGLQYIEEHGVKGSAEFFAMPISQNVTQDFFRGRDYVGRLSKESARILSVFERYDFEEIENAELSVHSHQFRHLLNTIIQESDVFGEHEIARYFLRNKIGDNAAYNHQLGPSDLIENSHANIDKVLKSLNITALQAQESRKQWPTLTYEDLLKDIEELGCSHTTIVGGCQHDYSQSPCQMHYQCLRNCRSYRRKKGDVGEITAVNKRLEDAKRQLEHAREDMADEFYGANNWVAHHIELVNGCNKALSIESDERYMDGEIVIVFPEGDEFCKV